MPRTKKTNAHANEIYTLTNSTATPDAVLRYATKAILENDLLGFFWKTETGPRIQSNSQTLKCMVCGAISEQYGLTHLSQHICLHCKNEIEIRNAARIKSFHVRHVSFALNFEAVEEAVVMRLFKIQRVYGGRHQNNLFSQYIEEVQRTILFDGAVYDYISKWHEYAGYELILRKSKVFDESNEYYRLSQTYDEIAAEVNKAGYAKHIFLDELAAYFVSKDKLYYKIAQKAYKLFLWPTLEYIYRCGYKKLYDEYLEGLHLEDRSLNLHKNKINSILGVPQSILKNYGAEGLISKEIKAIKEIICYGKLVQLTKERFEFIRHNCIVSDKSLGALDVFKDFGLEKVINYIKRVADGDGAICGCHSGGYGQKTYAQVYKDFLDYRGELHELGYDMTDEATMLPKDFYKAHSRTSREVIELKEADRIKAAAAKDGQFVKAVEKYLQLSANIDGLSFSVAASGTDIVVEGRTLGHCVSGYVDRIVGKRAVIFFVRKADSPDVPLYTLEYNPKTGNMVQLRGKCNALAPENIQTLAERFVAGVAHSDGFSGEVINLRAQG